MGKLNPRFQHVSLVEDPHRALPAPSSPRSSFRPGATAKVSVSLQQLCSFLLRMSFVGSEERSAFGAPWLFRSASQDPFSGLLVRKSGLGKC